MRRSGPSSEKEKRERKKIGVVLKFALKSLGPYIQRIMTGLGNVIQKGQVVAQEQGFVPPFLSLCLTLAFCLISSCGVGGDCRVLARAFHALLRRFYAARQDCVSQSKRQGW